MLYRPIITWCQARVLLGTWSRRGYLLSQFLNPQLFGVGKLLSIFVIGQDMHSKVSSSSFSQNQLFFYAICLFSKWFHILWSSKIKFFIKYWDQNQRPCEKEEKQSTKNQSSQVEVQVYKIKIKMKWSSFSCRNMLNKHLTSSRVKAFEFVWKFIYSKQDLGYIF